MPKYPDTITPEILEKHANIPDEEVLRDIADTQAEIEKEMKKAEAFNLLAQTTWDRMAWFRHDAAIAGAKEREEFVVFLTKLLEARKKVKEIA